MQYYRNFQLKNYNSFRLESIAKEIWFPNSITELQKLLKSLKGKEFFILSGGTNVILKPIISRIICLKAMRKALRFYPLNIEVTGNYSTTQFINECLQHSITGIEGLYGIPGTVGGAIVMNAGSGRYSISEYLSTLTAMDLEGNLFTTDKEYLQFNRRYSLFQDTKDIIISANFILPYGKMNVLELKKAKSHRKTLPKYASAGGIFVNWHELRPYSDKLIGLNDGDAIVSEKVNIIINQDNATFDNIMNLIKKIKIIVNKDLQLETKILGD